MFSQSCSIFKSSHLVAGQFKLLSKDTPLTEVDVGRQRAHLLPEQPRPSNVGPGTSRVWSACRPYLLLADLGPQAGYLCSWMSLLTFSLEGSRRPSVLLDDYIFMVAL